ncbi:hypothetical protein pb186bvf_014248 [Paramecium bursaria]
MENLLIKLDQFGVNYKPLIHVDQNEHQSLFGGVCTLIVHILGLVYFIYIIVIWSQNSILPTITIQNRADPFSKVEINQFPLLSMAYQKINQADVDPFNQDNLYFVPTVTRFLNKQFEWRKFLPISPHLSIYNTSIIEVNDIEISQNTGQLQDHDKIEYIVQLFKCDQTFLDSLVEGKVCAPESQVSRFLQNAQIQLWLNFLQFDQNQKHLIRFNKEIYMALNNQFHYFQQIQFLNAEAHVDDSILFTNDKVLNYIQDYESILFTQFVDQSKLSFGQEVYLSLGLRLDPLTQVYQISFPKLGQILAQIGSIANLLFSIKFLVFIFNQKQLDNLLDNEILKIYFSDLRDTKKFRTNILQKVTAVQNGYQKEFDKQYERLKQVSKQKQLITNIIYELSRIQFFLQRKYGRSELYDAHNYGINLWNESNLESMGSPENLKLKEDFILSDIELLLQPRDEIQSFQNKNSTLRK